MRWYSDFRLLIRIFRIGPFFKCFCYSPLLCTVWLSKWTTASFRIHLIIIKQSFQNAFKFSNNFTWLTTMVLEMIFSLWPRTHIDFKLFSYGFFLSPGRGGEKKKKKTTEGIFVWFDFSFHLQHCREQSLLPAIADTSHVKNLPSPQPSVPVPFLPWACCRCLRCTNLFKQQEKWFLNLGVLAVLVQNHGVCLCLLCFGIYYNCKMCTWLCYHLK